MAAFIAGGDHSHGEGTSNEAFDVGDIFFRAGAKGL
jgi:hypothetical protein